MKHLKKEIHEKITAETTGKELSSCRAANLVGHDRTTRSYTEQNLPDSERADTESGRAKTETPIPRTLFEHQDLTML